MSGKVLDASDKKRGIFGGIVVIILFLIGLFVYVLSSQHAQHWSSTGSWFASVGKSTLHWFQADTQRATIVGICMVIIAVLAVGTSFMFELWGCIAGAFIVYIIGYNLPTILQVIDEKTGLNVALDAKAGSQTVPIANALLGAWLVAYILQEWREKITELRGPRSRHSR